MKKAEYKVIVSDKGFEDFEQKVAEKLSQGWKPVGGVAFNHSYPHQALVRVVEATSELQKAPEKTIENNSTPRPLTANEAMKRIDDLT